MRYGAFRLGEDARVRPGRFTDDGRVEELNSWGGSGAGPSFAVDEITFAPAAPAPGKIIAAGRNYLSHVREGQKTWAARGRAVERPAFPSGFIRVASSLVGHGGAILIPPGETTVDYELELAVVIGREALRVSESAALDHVFGYCLCNDVSLRSLQLSEMEELGILVSKNFPGFGPLGPWVTTADEVGDPQSLDLSLTVNGEERQAVNTADMLFSVAELVSWYSRIGLEPGDVLITGTPSGVALSRESPEDYYLRAGDVVALRGDGLGELVNPVVEAP